MPIKVAILAEPEIVIFGAVKLPPALIKPAVNMLPPVILAADVIVLVADINPAVNIFAPTTLPVVLIKPDDVIDVSVPTEVIFG